MSYFDAQPTEPKEKLLRDIAAASQQGHMPGLPLVPFGALAVKLADEASETVADLKDHITKLNAQNARSQKLVVVLAIAALVGTFVQTGAAVYSVLMTGREEPKQAVQSLGSPALAPSATGAVPAVAPVSPASVPSALSSAPKSAELAGSAPPVR